MSDQFPIMDPGFGVNARIRAALPHMPAAMRRIGDFLLANPELPLHLAIGELAQKAGSSPATVTRFCRVIGYSGYPALRVAVATDLGRSDARHLSGKKQLYDFSHEQAPGEIMQTLLSVYVSTLRTTGDIIDTNLVQQVAASIAQARRVDLYGVGGSGVMAAMAEDQFSLIGVNAHAWTDVHLGLTSAVSLGESDVALAISSTGRTRETVEMLSCAKDRGALTVAITSDPMSPITDVADILLKTCPPPRFVDPSHMAAFQAQLFVLNLLYLLAAQHNHDASTDTLNRAAAVLADHRLKSKKSLRRR